MVASGKPQTAAEMLAALKDARKAGRIEAPDLSEFDENGFKLVPEKGKLVGIPFTVMQMERGMSKNNKFEELTFWAVTDAGVPVKFWDGSTGIYKQMDGYTGPVPFAAPKGLRVSEYQSRGASGGMARTYYFDTDL